ncbi:MAG: ABC transporter ATP-binding protein [Gemmataceae bacterium]|nr:ABC transporter ATP-binding protein [Gemmataceae bacterium]
MRPIIRIENLGKQYTIGTRRASYQTLRDSLADVARAPLRWLRGERSSSEDTIWALKDINLEVRPGEVVGIIGRNGAGKSTLLKVLSRITEPTTGRVELFGRVGSLLEVGTGFHPELTGRENIYLNGAILGMRRREIARHFDAIVAFAEVDQFLDTPVKHYSSGMYMRLAFAVAAHLEPEILVVDEVLAVGDLPFQQKCLNRMKTMTASGVTVLLVSHNMAAIQTCCSRVIVLHAGRVSADGEAVDVIETFQQDNWNDPTDYRGADVSRNDSVEDVRLVAFQMFAADGATTKTLKFSDPVRIRIDLHANRRIDSPMIVFGIKRADGTIICNFTNWYDNFRIDYIDGFCSLEGWLPPLRLIPGCYEIHALVWHWGGGHLSGDMTRSTPLASRMFGHFQVVGPPLHNHDGVFQVPAEKWRFSRGLRVAEHSSMTAQSVNDIFNEVELLQSWQSNSIAPGIPYTDPSVLHNQTGKSENSS